VAFLFRLTVEVTVYAVVVAVEPTELNIRYINYNNSSNIDDHNHKVMQQEHSLTLFCLVTIRRSNIVITT